MKRQSVGDYKAKQGIITRWLWTCDACGHREILSNNDEALNWDIDPMTDRTVCGKCR